MPKTRPLLYPPQAGDWDYLGFVKKHQWLSPLVGTMEGYVAQESLVGAEGGSPHTGQAH